MCLVCQPPEGDVFEFFSDILRMIFINSKMCVRRAVPVDTLSLPDTDLTYTKGDYMDTRIAVMSIIVENTDSAAALNDILHDYADFIIGRMGIPYRQRRVNIISVALDAPQATISAISGKIGNLEGVKVKTAFSDL